ncbi:uncharacterized protein FIBRA_07569 [Fibroporia radiculosa]|uniref:Protein N-terminal and lysine N-methyltransferase EFM7 n=1 Tax=Fibroporia radiculosa TaxID=599839 RepID=J4GV86_9APHY|nr:uncharacterized protein FIBRA_07569 [Fibroporia radiculosa]CCM05355.1 predicted protein [Fibroporia radiculosa]
MSDTEGGHTLGLDSIFPEPPAPPIPDPTTSTYVREETPINGEGRSPVDDEDRSSSTWSSINIRLVGSHPLWGHHLWNASRAFATYLDEHAELYKYRHVLELGAGGGLPGIVACKNGARTVVLTDYPDADLLENLSYNVKTNTVSTSASNFCVKGYIWGQPVGPLLDALPSPAKSIGFDLVIMSDLIFNHSQHDALLRACDHSLARPQYLQAADSSGLTMPPPCLLVFYTHHRPHLAHRDMEFFSKARAYGWHCEEILTRKFPPMFPEDPGDEEVRGTVHGWKLTR